MTETASAPRPDLRETGSRHQRGDVAAIDAGRSWQESMMQRRAVTVAAGGADGEIFDGDVLAERGVEGPHEVVAGGEVFEAEVGAVDRFD